ncbi:nuclear envelope pore membrane protein POM 121C-like [Anolis carolinensis]|uniref:nuclear envelope pore membrane protein POM 121C-like n=1 Tax=Anolis carolinensis TaxID=28377 RepID=UPI002F2B2519
MRGGGVAWWWRPWWVPSRRLRPLFGRPGLEGYIVEAPRRQAWRARWAWPMVCAAALAGLLLLLLPSGLAFLLVAAAAAGAWQARMRTKPPRHSARAPWPSDSSWQRRTPLRDASRDFDWDGSRSPSSSLTPACSPPSFQSSFLESNVPSSAFGRSVFGRSSPSSLDPGATFSPVTTPSRIGWRGQRGLLADFNAVMAERRGEPRTGSADSRLHRVGRPPSYRHLGPRATLGEAATPPSWVNRVLKDFSPAVAERRREAGVSSAGRSPLVLYSPYSSPVSLGGWPSRLALSPDPCARETVVKALREKEKAKRRRAEDGGPQQEPLTRGRDKRRRHESGRSVTSALEPFPSVSHAADPAAPDTLPVLKNAVSSSVSSSKRRRRRRRRSSTSLSSGSTESVSYGIPTIYKDKGWKATLASDPGQENWSEEPWCWQCSHLEESGPGGTPKPLSKAAEKAVDKAVQVEMGDTETPHPEAPGTPAPALRPNGPKRRSICLVRINLDEPLDLPPELQALSEAMKARAEAEKAARLQQGVPRVSEEQAGPLPLPPPRSSSSPSEVTTSPVSCLASAATASSALPLTVSSPTVVDSNPLTGPAPTPAVFGSGAPVSRAESLPPVTEMEVTEGAGSSLAVVATPPAPSPSAAQAEGGGSFLGKTPTKRRSSSPSELDPAPLTSPSKRRALAPDETAPVFRPVFGLSTPGLTLPSAAPPSTFQPIFARPIASPTATTASTSDAISTSAPALGATGVFASTLSLPLSGAATPPLPVVASNLFGGLPSPPPPPYTLTSQAAAGPAPAPPGSGSPFGHPAFGPNSTSGASQPTYSLAGSFRFGAATTTAGGEAAGPAPTSGATTVPLLPPLMDPVGSSAQTAFCSPTFSTPVLGRTRRAFGGGSPSGSGPSAANPISGPSPLTFAIGAGAKSGARQRLQARRQHPRRK